MLGTLFINDRDVESDFAFVVSGFSDWPGNMGAAPRDVALSDAPEMQGAILDPRLLRRRAASPTIKGIVMTASMALALAAQDALRGLLLSAGEVAVRTVFAPDRYCLAVCDGITGAAQTVDALNGNIALALSFQVKDGVAFRNQPDGYALSTTRTACPIGTAESRPVMLIHGGGAALTNPTVTVRNAAGDIVQQSGYTVSLGANDALRVDCARAQVSRVTAGVSTDALQSGYWTSGDYAHVLRPYDALVEAGAYPSVELSASAGTAVGDISYRRRFL